MSGPAGLDLDLGLVARLEEHSVLAWPPAVCEDGGDGWLLRATPGLDRARSNHALTPCRALRPGELVAAVDRVAEFAALHGLRAGIQVSPLELHGAAAQELAAIGWTVQTSVQVLAGRVSDVTGGGPALALDVADTATEEWLAAWAECEPGRDIEAHAATVFPRLRGRARFVRDGEHRAVGISVESDGLVGLFCLAVAPGARRRGLGSALVRGMLADAAASLVYLQVESSNAPALAMYDRLGFWVAYRYLQCVAPATGDQRATLSSSRRALS